MSWIIKPKQKTRNAHKSYPFHQPPDFPSRHLCHTMQILTVESLFPCFPDSDSRPNEKELSCAKILRDCPSPKRTWTQKFLKLNSTLPVHDVRRLSVLLLFLPLSFTRKKNRKRGRETRPKQKKKETNGLYSFLFVCLFDGRRSDEKKNYVDGCRMK